VWRNSE